MNATRRALLGFTLALPAAWKAAPKQAVGTKADGSPATGRTSGYHVTEHIRTYYRIARF